MEKRGNGSANAEQKLIKREKVFAKNFVPPFYNFSLAPHLRHFLFLLPLPVHHSTPCP